MTPEGAENLMRNIVDTFVRPEIERRKREGTPVNSEVWAAQVVFGKDGNVIRLNREVRLAAQPIGSAEVGDYVELFEKGCRAFAWARLKPDEKSIKHMTLYQKGVTSHWETFFSLGDHAEPSEPQEGQESFDQGYIEPTPSEWEQLYKDHDAVADEVFAINSPTAETPIEGIMAVALQRSRHLLQAYVQLLASKNLTAASALIRMQLDSLMRVNACFLVENPMDLWNVLKSGDPWNSVRSKDGKPLTDGYLHEELSAKFEWATEIYRQMSGYIHLSRPHLESTVEGENFLGMVIKQGPAGEGVTSGEIAHNAELFVKVTKALLQLCSEYAHRRYAT
jgi:hypothetical protein